MAMTSIPSFFVLPAASGGPYLWPNNTEKSPSGLLEFGEPDIFSPRVKFAAEQSKTGDPSLVHIRSCFNNKYWVAHEAGQGVFNIAASANKPQEDTKDPACTLFRVSSHSTSNGTKGFRFFSVSRSLNALYYFDGFALSGTFENITENVFPVINWERLVILPSQVTFRSEHLNGNYLSARVIDGYNHNSFQSGFDVGDPKVGYELVPASDGNYRIKSLSYGKWLTKINPEWIAAYTDDNNSDDTLFSFIKINDNNVFALSYLGNQKFCGGAGANNALSASYSQVSKETRLIVEERALQKKISNVRYRLGDAIIHDEQVEEVVNLFVTNEGKQDTKTTLEFSQSESFTTSWNNSSSVSISTSYSFGFEVGAAPFVVKEQVEISSQVSFSHEWGKANTSVKTSTANHEVTVPSKKTMKASLMVVNGVCDVPFSYTETVLLPNGEWVSKEKDDGIYRGIRSLNFYVDSKEVPYNPSLGKVIGQDQ